MKFSTTFIFTLLFLLVLGVYFYLNPRLASQKESHSLKNEVAPEEAQEQRLLPLEKGEEIIRLQLEKIILEKTPEGWFLITPVRSPADPVMVDGMVLVLTVTQKVRTLTREKDWSEFGLDIPNLALDVTTQKGDVQQSQKLLFGNASPVGDYVYARWASEDPEYFMLDSAIKSSFRRSLYSLRQKRIFEGPMDKIRKIQMHTPEGDYELAKQEGRWFWTEPIPLLGETVEASVIQNLLAGLRDLYVKEFLDERSAEDSDTGISPLGFRMALWNEQNEITTLYLGNQWPERDAYFASKDGEKTLLLLARSNVDALFQFIESQADVQQNKQNPPSVILSEAKNLDPSASPQDDRN